MLVKFKSSVNYGLLLGIILVAANLRSPLTSVGSLVSLIKLDLNLSSFQSGLITTVPLICFALISPLATKISEKISIEKTILISLISLTVGIIIRSLHSILWLFLGTIIIGCSIAICNVLIPALIKREFSQKSGLITGIYSVSMNLCGAIASGISFPLAENLGLGWYRALQIWAILAFLSCICWLPQLRRKDLIISNTSTQKSINILKSKLAWSITFFMGLQSLFFYVLIAWLPEILIDLGINATKAGIYLSTIQITMLPINFIIPIIAERKKDQKSLVIFTCIMLLLGITLILLGNVSVLFISMIFLGIGSGSAFALAMIFFSLRTSNANEAASLSGMAQSAGYLFASFGPLLFGTLFDYSKSWNIPLYLLIILVFIFIFFGLRASQDKKI